jgi:hypothetical protein
VRYLFVNDSIFNISIFLHYIDLLFLFVNRMVNCLMNCVNIVNNQEKYIFFIQENRQHCYQNISLLGKIYEL